MSEKEKGDWGLGIGPQSPIPNPHSSRRCKFINFFININYFL
jgi:hypothetical protein